MRRAERKGERVWVSAVDAVNLVGVLIESGATDAGAAKRVPAQPGKGVMFIDGLPQLGVEQPVTIRQPLPSKALERLRRGLPSRCAARICCAGARTATRKKPRARAAP